MYILIRHDRMYAHKVLKVNYTTYDMRRDQDVLNPGTSRCNIMVLAQPDADEASGGQHFLYGRILGIYHVNVIYNGPGMVDYTLRRFDFLWVRWYDLEDSVMARAKKSKASSYLLDRLVFPPLNAENAVGFLDPASVLRGCHIIPAFAKGKRFPEGQPGQSKRAQDVRDWKGYYVSRYGSKSKIYFLTNAN